MAMVGGFFALIGPLIFLHELGHYAVGRLFGVKVDAFSIGMGRELFAMFRKSVSIAEEGAATFDLPPPLHLPQEQDNPLAVPEAQSFSDEDHLIRR